MNDIILSMQNGEPVVSSRQIADSFEKRHDHVMRDIEDIMRGLPKNGDTPMFYKTEYTHEQNGQTYPMYLMNRDGKDPKRSDYNLPTQRSMEMGLFEIKETTIQHSDHISINRTPKISGRGQVYFVNLFLKAKRNQKAED